MICGPLSSAGPGFPLLLPFPRDMRQGTVVHGINLKAWEHDLDGIMAGFPGTTILSWLDGLYSFNTEHLRTCRLKIPLQY